MVKLAFVSTKVGVVWKVGGARQCSAITATPTTQTRMLTSAAVSRRTKLAQLQKVSEAQGPYCRLVDQVMVRHCLQCAKEVEMKRQGREKEKSVVELLAQARQAIRVTQRGLAERFFLRALVVDPGNSRTYFLYALQVQRRDPILARELFRQGLREDPNNAKILQAWGLFESKQGCLPRAQRLLRRSVYLEPQHAPVLKWKVLFPSTKG